ncbi:MAG: LytTR family transcriptional regulator DNA-binding domain-containing protein [Ruminococcus sp.]|nr:LytTR family transcriptional regulator DNA-binding domain-containing protein [Ruminococcus sp.]
MKKINVRFEQDSSLDTIEVTVRAAGRDEYVEELLSKLAYDPTLITVSDENGVVKTISPDEIYFISVNGRTTDIVLENVRYSVKRSLQSIEEVLDSRRFIRISRYEIINIRKVKQYDFTLKGTLRIEFKNGLEAWASRRSIPAIRRMLSGKE